jgi:antitoxin ParD1/3/4
MSTNVSLTRALEQFARECVENGRYNNVSEVVRDALRLLQEREQRIRDFQQSLKDAVEETDRLGAVTLDESMARAGRTIEKLRKKHGRRRSVAARR